MANTFSRKISRNVGTSLTAVGTYVVGGGVVATAFALLLANTSAVPILVDVTLNDGANDYYIAKGMPLNVGSSLAVLGGDAKAVMVTGDSIQVKSSVAASLDAVLSILEQT